LADIVEIIISAIDKASPVFSQIGSEVSEMASEVDSAIDGVDADKLAEEFQDVDSAIEGIDGDSLTDIDSDIEQLEREFEEATQEVERLEDALDQAHFDGDDIEADRIADELAEAREKAEQLQQALEQAGNSNGLDKLGTDVQEDKSKFTQLRETITNTFESAKGIVSGFGTTLNELGNKVTGVGGKFRNLRNNINYAGVGAQSAGASFGFLRDAASMTVGMVGYDLVNGFVEAGRAAINARSQFDYFAGRLKMSGTQVSQFKQEVADMQQEFRKVDMTAVAATAEEIAVKNGLAADSVGELTRMTAVMSSTFVKEGRTQEDAILAVSDALDGQFKRLQEIGITQEDLKNNGWSGDLADQEGLIKALSKTMKDMGYEQTAKDITNLDEAFTALSISGGQLLADILVPLAPTLISIMEGAMVAADGISDFIGMIQSTFAGLPDWAQISLGVTALGIAFGIVGTIILSTYVPGMVASVIATINWIATALGAEVSAITLSGAFSLLATSIWAALAPLLPFIIAGALIVAAIYEIGKAFGWWTDVGSMLSAIQAGVNRLWSAFINHPDVQAAIKVVSNALQTLWTWIQQAGQAIMEFFGIATGGDFDVVHALIVGIGEAWNIIKEPIVAVIDIIWSVIDVFSQLANGQMDLETAILTVWNSLQTNLPVILNFILTYVMGWMVQLGSMAVTAGWNFLSGIGTYVSQLPGRFWSYLVQTGTRINTQFNNWINRARNMAIQFVLRIITQIATLPSKMLARLMAVVSSIVSAGSRWVSTARQKATELVNGAVNTISQLPGKISSALSGVVDAIVAPFRNAYNQAKQIWDDIVSMANNVPSFGGETAYGGEIAFAGEEMTTSSTIKGWTIEKNNNVDVNVAHKIMLDLLNVPAHIDTETLIKMLKNKEVLKSLTGNRDFQDLDAKVKKEILKQIDRARGA